MTSAPQFARRGPHRARHILDTVAKVYPQAWAAAERFRALRAAGELDWPDWCYLPVHGGYAVVTGGSDTLPSLPRMTHPAIVTALAGWRVGQQVMRYDPVLYRSLIDTPVTGNLPVQLLYRLPAWCVYIETPDLELDGKPLHGMWVHLDHDQRPGAPAELRLLLDQADVAQTDPLQLLTGLLPIPLLLGAGGIEEALERLTTSAQEQWQRLTGAALTGVMAPATVAGVLAPIMSLVLYLCSDAPDWGKEPPANPRAVRTRRDGWRIFPPDRPEVWDVGTRLGAALRVAYQAHEVRAGAAVVDRAGPAPHLRGAHWHTFLSGPRLRADRSQVPTADRRRELRWMPPIPVAMPDPAAAPTTIRPVR